MKVLLTGAAGRVGSAVCRALVEAGFDVRATDRWLGGGGPVRIELTDLRDPLGCYRLLEGCQALVHLANHPNHNEREAQSLFNDNVTMNMNIFHAAHELGVRKIVFSSTVQVFSGSRPMREGADLFDSELAYLPLDGNLPVMPRNSYALSKVVSETMLRYYSRTPGMQCVALRLPLIITDRRFRRFRLVNNIVPWRSYNLDEAFTCLMDHDAGTLVAACLKADLPGMRTYFPAASLPLLDLPVPQIVERYFAAVPRRKPLNEMTSLVDTSLIQHETGWQPTASPESATTD